MQQNKGRATWLLQVMLLMLLLLVRSNSATTTTEPTDSSATSDESTTATSTESTTATSTASTTPTSDESTTATSTESTTATSTASTTATSTESTTPTSDESTTATSTESTTTTSTASTTTTPTTTTELNLCSLYGYLCQNGGTCVKKSTYDYKCECAAGFIGLFCNIEITSSSVWCGDLNPCVNGATCSPTDDNYFVCNCVPGFDGSFCENDKNECLPNPCVNGECVDEVNKFTCVCKDGWEGNTCATDINECLNNACDPNANCDNTPGSYSCQCKPGYYGNGTVCHENTILATTNATTIAKDSFNANRLSSFRIQSTIPFVIGQEEALTCKISSDGYLTFGEPAYQYSWPTWYTYLTNPMVFPYWSYRYNISDSAASVKYELLNNEDHSNTENLRRVGEIVTAFDNNGQQYKPLSALIVTWAKVEPYSWYRWLCYYCNRYYRELGQSWAERYCKYCNNDREELTFQAIVTRNESHSLAIFNYGEFKFAKWRYWYYYTAAGYSDGHNRMQKLPFSYYWYRSSGDITDNLRVGNTGKAGRHLLVLAESLPPSKKLQCRNWMTDEQKHRKLENKMQCTTCPRDLRQALLDWRYWPYQYSCDKRGAAEKGRYKFTMCFRGQHRCLQDFKDYTCKWRWSWWCQWERCQFFHSPRCCYKLNINWKKEGVLYDYCSAGYSVWQMRWMMRNELADRNRSGHLIRSTKHGAGHSMLIERSRSGWWWFSNYDQQLRNETHGYDVCRAARMHGRYKKLRPKCNFKNYVEPVWGFNRGDPHINTIDGRTYSFNGLCEYYMVRNMSSEYQMLEVQARTAMGKSARPSVPSRATVFSGFALKAGTNNKSIALLMNAAADDIEVYADSDLLGTVRSDFFGRENATEVENYSLQANTNSSITVSESDTGYSITVSLSISFLQAEMQLDQDKHAAAVQGLMGNFNGNDTDDFLMRNGTMLPADSSERQLFDFGQSWRLLPTDTSHFPYPSGKTAADYCNTTFVPIFVEDYKNNMLELFSNNSALMDDANKTCQNANEIIYLSCMYDAAQLQTLSAAEEAVLKVQQEVQAKAVSKNKAPVFSMPENITVHADTTFNITISYSDPDANPMTLELQEPSNDSSIWLDGNVLVWQVGRLNDSVNVTVVATDSLGAPAAWQPVILYCHCMNNGQCSFEYATTESSEGETFYKAQCNCPDGYGGDSCEISPCDANPPPCYNRTMCNMHANGSYYCDPCPSGLVGDGKMCEDTDECLETPGICQEKCTNLAPGYECSCTTTGYKVSPTNQNVCVDIDECADGSHKCQLSQNQTCVNTPGSYACNCTQSGFRINALYQCKDINECKENSNLCSGETCINTPGSYYCSCNPGEVRKNGKCKVLVIDTGSTPPATTDTTIVIVVSVIGSLVVVVGAAVGVLVLCRSKAPVASG